MQRPEAAIEASGMRSSRQEPSALAQATASNHAPQEELREYLTLLDDTNLSEAQKTELLQTLWTMMSAFVDLAFTADTVQLAQSSKAADPHTKNPTVAAVKSAERG